MFVCYDRYKSSYREYVADFAHMACQSKRRLDNEDHVPQEKRGWVRLGVNVGIIIF